MKRGTEVRELLAQFEDAPVPEPSALFVAKLGAELQSMSQTTEADPRRARTRRARLLVAAAPVAALATAAAAAAVTLLPSKPHPHEVHTADPGITASAPPETAPSTVPTPTTVVVAPPWLPPTDAPTPPTTSASHATSTLPAPKPAEQSTGAAVPPAAPVNTTAPPVTTTTTSGQATISLHCAGGVSGTGQSGVSCAWSQSSSPSFAWYRLYREVPGTNRVLIFSSDNRATAGYADTNVQTGTTYSYRVEVTDSAGNVIARSDPSAVSCC
jgi:hypothetical protein